MQNAWSDFLVRGETPRIKQKMVTIMEDSWRITAMQ